MVPITSENFRNLCIGTSDGLTYKNTYFNRIIKGFIIGGGELQNNIDEKKCIYGQYFDDENYNYGHCRRGLLTMDNDGKNKNNSKFLITLNHIPWFDGKHVVFGQVINGMEIIEQIENIETDKDDKPLTKIIIINCGEINKNDIKIDINSPTTEKEENNIIEDNNKNEEAKEFKQNNKIKENNLNNEMKEDNSNNITSNKKEENNIHEKNDIFKKEEMNKIEENKNN